MIWNRRDSNTNACVKQCWLTRLWMLKFKTPERTQQTNDKKCSDHFCFKGSMDTTLFLLHELIFTRTHSREHSWLQNAKPSLFPSLKAFHWHSVIHTILIICRHLLAVEMRVVGISSCSRLHSTARSVMSSPWTKEWMEVPIHQFSLQIYLISAKFGRLGTHRPEFAKWIREGSRKMTHQKYGILP